MKNFDRKRKKYRFFWLATALILVLISIVPVRLAIALHQTPLPQAILTLGGDPDREVFTAQFAQAHPALEIWISSPPEKVFDFQTVGISKTRVHIDRRAVDTVTNFTSLVKDFKSRKIQHLYLITSDYHILRAKAIATFILGSKGITFTPVSVPSERAPESWLRILRDITRAILWIFTGHTGARFNQQL